MDVRKREYFLDRLRVAATCAVVLLHTVTGVMDTTDMNPYPGEKRLFLVVLDLVCWCVPVFLIISGYLFLNPHREFTFRSMIIKYCRRVLLALFLFGVPYACLEQAALEKTFRVGMIGKGFLMVLRGESWAHMWYLYLIFFLYLLTPGLKRLLHKMPKTGVYILLAVLFIGSSILPFLKKLMSLDWLVTLPDGGIYLFYYICGYLFVCGSEIETVKGIKERDTRVQGLSHDPAMGKPHAVRKVPDKNMDLDKRHEPGRKGNMESRYGWLWPGIALILAVGMTISRLVGSYTVQMAYNYPFTVALALALFAWGLQVQRQGRCGSKYNGFWEKASALSFGVYLIHPVFLNLCYKFLHVTPLSHVVPLPFAVWASLPLFFLGALLTAAVGAWILRKIPALRKYVL